MEDKQVNINEFLTVLRKRIEVIISIVLIFTIVSIVISFFIMKPKYNTSAKLFIGKEQIENQASTYQNSDVQMYLNLMKTYAGLFESEDMIQSAINNSDLDLTADEILKSLKVTPGTDDQFLTVSIVTGNKQKGVEILNILINEFINKSKEYITNGNVKVVTEPKMPEYAYSPNKKLNIIIGFSLGLLVGIAVVLLLEYSDNSIKRKEDIEEILDVPVLGLVPNFDSEKKSNK